MYLIFKQVYAKLGGLYYLSRDTLKQFIIIYRLLFETPSNIIIKNACCATGRESFVFQDSGVSHNFILIISNEEKILGNVNVVV